MVWGSSEGVGVQELARLRAIEEREEERAGQLSNRHLIESWQTLHEREEVLDARAADLRARLERIGSAVGTQFEALEAARVGFEKAQEGAKADRLRREAELDAFASEKIRRIYRHMRPAVIAADIEARMRKGEGEKAVAILKKLPERAVAEILEAMADAAARNELYDLMRTPPVLTVTGERGEGRGQAE